VKLLLLVLHDTRAHNKPSKPGLWRESDDDPRTCVAWSWPPADFNVVFSKCSKEYMRAVVDFVDDD
jgi:hypothetical protein